MPPPCPKSSSWVVVPHETYSLFYQRDFDIATLFRSGALAMFWCNLFLPWVPVAGAITWWSLHEGNAWNLSLRPQNESLRPIETAGECHGWKWWNLAFRSACLFCLLKVKICDLCAFASAASPMHRGREVGVLFVHKVRIRDSLDQNINH